MTMGTLLQPDLSEFQRKAIHLSFLALPLAYLYGVPKHLIRDILLAMVVIAFGIELLRLNEPRVRLFFRQFFGNLIRRHEKRALLGSTYMLIAALISVELFTKPVCVAALGCLILGDAAASLVGKTWGRTRPFGSKKSLEGSAACLIASFAFAYGIVHLPLHVALAGAFAGTLFEILPLPLDDNFAVPLSSGFTMKLLM
jgi:acyl phosphate:glycerol-3-phosphate acyltransferase